jgi:adenylosuccinate synthase
MPCTIIVGGQWGDEAKGKIASYLALVERPQIVCRGGLGPGAGHTVVYDGKTVKLRQLPSAVVVGVPRVLIGAGALISAKVVLDEVDRLKLDPRSFGVDHRASTIEQDHIDRDRKDGHLRDKVGSTGSGHGPCLADRAMRCGPLTKDSKELAPYLTDVSRELNEALDRGEIVHLEGTNGFMLSVLFGSYPYVVGKDSTASSVAVDVGIGPRRVDEVVLVFKTFPTRVGGGEFPTEMPEDEARRRGFDEYGTVTGRRRRVGAFDFELAREAVRVNHPSQIALTFLDRIDPACTGQPWDSLSQPARAMIDRVEHELNCPVTLIGTGAGTTDIIDRRKLAR